MSAQRGRFISLEGGEGVGKSTQARALASILRGRGIDLVETREPGGPIRELLLQGEPGRWTAEAEAMLFAAARADHVAGTIRPALDAGRSVLCDRFVDSSLAYQGIAGGLGEDAIRTLHAIGSGGLMPDVTLLLALDPDEALARALRRDRGIGDRFERKDAAYHERVGAAFAMLATLEPERIKRVDASGTIEAVTARLIAALD